MATNGQVKTPTEYESYFWVEWEQVGDQDIANNRTQIKWTCGLNSSHKFYTNAVKMSAVSINGTQVYSGGTYSNFTSEGKQTIASGTLWIAHNADGTKSFSISAFTGWLYSNHNYSSNGGSFTLNAIPRQATITSAPDFKDTDNPTITYSNPAGNAVSRLRACISFTGADADIEYREISKTGSSYQFILTEAERDVLRNGTTGTERNVQFFVTTNIGGTDYYSILHRKLTIAESGATKPTVTMTKAPNNSSLPSAFSGVYIQGKSRLNVTLSATGKYGASIQSYSAVVDGKTYNSNSGNFTSEVVQGSGSVKIVGYAKDSRGFTGFAEATINVEEYAKPQVINLGNETAIQCYRSDDNGNRVGNSESLWIKAKRSYHRVSGKNTCALQWRWKPAASQWKDDDQWDDLLYSTDSTDEYNSMVTGTFDTKTAYTVQIRAIDYIGEQDVKTFEIPTEDVALHLGAGGKKVAVGTYCGSEDYTFYSAWKAIFDNDVVIGGYKVGDFVVDCTKDDTTGYFKQTWRSGMTEFYHDRKFFDTSNPDVLSWAWQLTAGGFDGIMHIQLGNGANAPTTYCNGLVISNSSNRCNVVVFGATEIYTNLNQGSGWLGWRKISTTAVT